MARRQGVWVAVYLIALAACGAAPSAPPAGAPVKQSVAPATVLPAPPDGARLPRTFVPTAYAAQLTVGLQLTAHMEITGQLAVASSVIWLHGVALDVVTASATHDGVRVPLAVRSEAWNESELIAFQAAAPLAPGAWTIALDYRAPIGTQELLPDDVDMHDAAAVARAQEIWKHDRARGAFSEQVGGETYVFTQFEAMDARRVFPCLDEPDVKVPWTLSLVVPASDVAASNTAVVRETPLAGGLKRVDFAQTKPLPSYVIAFAVGPFEIVDAGQSRGGVPVRVLLPHGTSGHEHALADGQLAGQVLDALAAWTAIPYAYGKLDLVGVPRTGNEWAAMENPGLVTFAARFLDPSKSSLSWVGVVAHELAHQWFGDLVTPRWWDDVWLSEGFAEWIGGKAVAQVSPATADPSGFANYLDDELVPHAAVRGMVTRAADVEKYMGGWHGAQELRMLEAYVGADAFQRAVRRYLAAHAGGNATTADLVAAFDVALGGRWSAPFADALEHVKPPVITAQLACDGGRERLHVTGARTVPVCVAYDRNGSRARTCGLLGAGGAMDIPLDASSCPTWALPNADGAGTYGVAWDVPSLLAVIQHGWRAMTPADRAELARELTLADAPVVLQVIPALDAIGDPEARAMIVAILGVRWRLVPDDLRPKFEAWVRARFSADARALHFRVRPHDDRGTRADRALAWLAADANDPALAADAIAVAAAHGEIADEYRKLVLVLAETLDSGVADRILDEVAKITARDDDDGIDVLRAMHDIVDVLARDQGRLLALREADREQLISYACSPKERAAIAGFDPLVLPAAPRKRVLKRIDDCIARGKALDPAFRAWLAPVRP